MSLFNRFNSNKCKTQAKLCIGRVRLMRNKRQIVMKQTRREVAELLRLNRQENARIRVEAVLRDQHLLQAYEVLEVFLELLSVRLQLVERSVDIPNDMFECLASLVYAASRLQDFPELLSIRAMLGSKYGKEFIEKASSDTSCRQFMVNENLITCLAVVSPDPEAKLALLSEIAQEHNVEWDTHRAHQEMVAGQLTSGAFGPPGGSGGFPGGGSGSGGFGGGGGGGQAAPQQPMFVPPPTPFGGTPPRSMEFAPPPAQAPAVGHQPAAAAAGNGASEGAYADAHAAASAAREYSQQAQSAADAAQRFASRSMPPPAAVVPPPAPAAAAQPDFPAINMQQQQQKPPGFTPMSSSLQGAGAGQGDAPPPAAAAPPPAGQPPRPYRQRSDEEIQAAYDAAPGPPAKPQGPPSAPPAPPPATRDGSLGLPSPPGASSAAPPQAPDVEDDLAARFEALKKS